MEYKLCKPVYTTTIKTIEGTTMHPYSINSNERSIIQLILATISIPIAWYINNQLNLAWWIEAPSILGVYGLLHLLFDQVIWKINMLHQIGLIQTPNLNGTWTGYVKSSYDNYQNEYDVELRILQNWTTIDISLISSNSNGTSNTASIVVEKNRDTELIYTYLNEPKPSAVPSMNIHRGTSTLCFSENFQNVKGVYYSGRGRAQTGEITLTKEEKS